jgi:hypothetical protein
MDAAAENADAGVKSRTVWRLTSATLLSVGFDLAGKSYGGRTLILAEPATTASLVATFFYLPHLIIASAAYEPLRWVYLHVSRAAADLGVVVLVLPISYAYVWVASTILRRGGRARRTKSK